MKRWLIALAMVSSLCRVAFADDDDPLYTCRAASATTQMSASFQPETSLRDLAIWIMGFTCKNVIFSADVAKHATRVTILSPNKMTPKQALQLFVDAVEATGLVVTQKAETIIIKLGPGMPQGCPDSAPVSSVRTPAPSSRTPPPEPDEPALVDADLAAGIKVLDDTHRTIARALLDKILMNPMAAAKGARVVPAIKNGKQSGFKLYAIRPSSVWAWLGLQNGDTIESINKRELTSADEALEIYTKLRDATQLEVQLTRRGKPVLLVITIK